MDKSTNACRREERAIARKNVWKILQAMLLDGHKLSNLYVRRCKIMTWRIMKKKIDRTWHTSSHAQCLWVELWKHNGFEPVFINIVSFPSPSLCDSGGSGSMGNMRLVPQSTCMRASLIVSMPFGIAPSITQGTPGQNMGEVACRAASVFRAHVAVVCTTMTRVECFHSQVVEVMISETTGRVLLNNAAIPETFCFNHAQALRDLLAPESTLFLALDWGHEGDVAFQWTECMD